MPRPGFVLEVDERTPPLLVNEGEGYRMQRFPLGTKVIYPPDALPGRRRSQRAHPARAAAPDRRLEAAARAAVRRHEADDRRRRHLAPAAADGDTRCAATDPGARDRARRARRRRRPRDRRRHRAAPADDRRPRSGGWSASACSARSGPRRSTTSTPRTPTNMTVVGQTDHGETVQIQKRAADSDLIVYVNINLVAMDGGHKSVAIGLAGYESLKHHHNVNTMLHSQSYMDPREGHSAINDSTVRMGRYLRRQRRQGLPDRDHVERRDVPVAARLPEQARVGVVAPRTRRVMMAAKKANDLAPPRIRREFFRQDRGAVQGDRDQRRRGRGRARAHARRTCTASSWSRWRASPTSRSSASPTSGPTT